MPAPHLLVVEDQRLDRAIASYAASQIGLQVSSAATIAETQALLESDTHFDFILLDLALGAEDGLELLPIIARYAPTAVLVLASGFDSRILASSQRLAASLGLLVAGVLRKPILPEKLQRMLHQTPYSLVHDPQAALVIPHEELRQAIEAGEIQAWFQPKASLADRTIVGAEALARWIRPDRRLILPAAFVTVAEHAGLIGTLTDTILDQALGACANWRIKRPSCCVSVNISPLLLNDPSLVERIEHLLHTHNVPPTALEVEITETNGIPDTPCATEILTRLRIRGVNLALDDFGTGHSSLLSLVRMPFNTMKIDQAFVRDATANRDSYKVVRASASLGRELGLSVVAEGVEIEALAQLAANAGCHIGQGWLFGRAVPASTFEATLDASPTPSDNGVAD